MARSHSVNDSGPYHRPPTGYRLSRFVDSINNKRSRYASANFLLTGYGKLDSMRLTHFILLKWRNYQRYRCIKNFRILNESRENGDRGYRIFHPRKMDPPAFYTQSHFGRAFLTGILLHAYVKAPPTHSRAHIRERPAFHWHSTSRGEFHLYANLKPRAHFCIPPWDPVETCPMRRTPSGVAQPGCRTTATGVSFAKRREPKIFVRC